MQPEFGVQNDEETDLNEKYEFCVNLDTGNNALIAPALFRVLRICCLKTKGDLEDIDAILGTPILFRHGLTTTTSEDDANNLKNCINWIREVASAFVIDKKNNLRQQVCQRLSDLMKLQGELVKVLADCNRSFSTLPCYFDVVREQKFVHIANKNLESRQTDKKGPRRSKSAIDNINFTEKTSTKYHREWQIIKSAVNMSISNSTFFRRLDGKVRYCSI